MGLELIGVAMCLGGVLVSAAMLTLGPEGSGGSLRNVIGPWGRGTADALARGFGLGAWMLPIFAVLWGARCVRGDQPRNFARRLILLPVLMALVATAAALFMRSCPLPGLERSGPGGYLGVAAGHLMYRALGAGSGLVALFGIFAVLRLITDVNLAPLGARIREAFGLRPSTKPREADVESDDDQEWEYEDEDEYGDADYEEEYEYEEDEGDEEYEYEYEDEAEYEEEDEAPAPKTKPAKRRKRAAPLVTPAARKKKKSRPKDRGEYVVPSIELLAEGSAADPEAIREEVEANVQILEETLASFGVEARVVSSVRGPVITFCEIKVPSGIRLSRVTALADDLAIALKAPSVRIVAPIPGRSTVGIEVPNLQRDTVCIRDLLEQSGNALERKAIPILLGTDTSGRPIIEDLASMPHLMIAGATGSGKSVCINSILLSILFTRSPDEVNLILIDPKQVELSFFEGIPHLITPVVTDMKRASKILEWAVERMEERYSWLLACGVRNIAGYNKLPKEKRAEIREKRALSEDDLPDHMPYLTIIVDELADLMLTNGKDVELAITRLAQKSRAVGIHIVLATQRPSTNVITGLIKANMPTRIAFVVSSKIDSRVILDANGADKLLGMGDMLYMHPRSLHLRRAQGTLVTDDEARSTVDFLKGQYPDVEYEDLLKKDAGQLNDPMAEDDLYNDAVRAVLSSGLGSASMLQRRMGIGYTRASRLIDMMCDREIVGPHVGSKAREVLVDLDEWEAIQAEMQGKGLKASQMYDEDDPPCVDESWD